MYVYMYLLNTLPLCHISLTPIKPTTPTPSISLYHYNHCYTSLGKIKNVCAANPEMPLSQHLPHVQHWSHRVQGTVYVLCLRPDGTIVVSEDMRTVYLVQGITQSLASIVSKVGIYRRC
jgi:hypothetical protein